MASHHPIRKTVTPPSPVIPDKLYFRIGDVARLCEVPAYVLRFWETEFPNLKPNKGGTGQRLYRKRDVETALRIKHLLYDLGYTIPGARQVFKADSRPREAGPHLDAKTPTLERAEAVATVTPIAMAPDAHGHLAEIAALREELRALHAQLAAPVGTAASPRPQLVPDLKAKSESKADCRPTLAVLPGQQALFPVD